MRKRAGLARALVMDPAIVMFDEPDSGLDPVRTALLCELIREVHAEHRRLLLMIISHDLNTARRVPDFLAVLWKGRIVESGPREEFSVLSTRLSPSSCTPTLRDPYRWIDPPPVRHWSRLGSGLTIRTTFPTT